MTWMVVALAFIVVSIVEFVFLLLLSRELTRQQRSFVDATKLIVLWFTKYLERDKHAKCWKRVAKKYFSLNKQLAEKYSWEKTN